MKARLFIVGALDCIGYIPPPPTLRWHPLNMKMFVIVQVFRYVSNPQHCVLRPRKLYILQIKTVKGLPFTAVTCVCLYNIYIYIYTHRE